MDFTIIGNYVNIAPGTEGLTKKSKKSLPLSHAAYQMVRGDFAFDPPGEFSVSGDYQGKDGTLQRTGK